MAKGAVNFTVHRTAGSFSTAGNLTGPGGLVQRGGYGYGAQRAVNILSRSRPVFPIQSSKVGGGEQKLPKGMD